MTNAASHPSLAPGIHEFPRMERVYWGNPAIEGLKSELERHDSQRVFLLTNRSLAKSPQLQGLTELLGNRLAGRFDAIRAHSPREDVVAAANAARTAGADLLLAFGGGSVVDGSKAVSLCLRHGIGTVEQMDSLAGKRPRDRTNPASMAGQWVRIISVPTTLSGAEFAAPAGVTDTRALMKEPFDDPMLIPVAVILDPAMTLSAPLELIKSTGMKAIDHAVERMTSATANPFSDSVSGMALQMLAHALRNLNDSPTSLQLRSRLQYGMFLSVAGKAAGVSGHVSHAIGHVLGGHAGVEHGHTTGLLLPAVLRWNLPETAAVQQHLCHLLESPATHCAAEAIGNLARDLGLPVRLRDVGLTRDQLSRIADKVMHERLLKNSRKPVTQEDVVQILNSAW